jgi:hypothetical protein
VSVAREGAGAAAPGSGVNVGEKSIRLQGPGVNRARQIRV